ESALLLDPSRQELRDAFADVTLARLLAAERNHRKEEQAELLERLRAYDASGTRLRWLEAPATLSVTSQPAASRVSLRRYDAQGRLQDEELAPGALPLPELSLAPGSYLLELRHEGHAPVRLPLVARRGERLSLHLPLPPERALPPGFLYVPEGTAALGFAGDEDVRRGFFGTSPLHEVRTGPYLIGRTEVTFAEWMEYLRALPAPERARRMPRGRTLRNSLELRELASGRFELTLQPTIHAYRAEEGAPLRYQGRQRRAEQDWRRFPVSAISFEDALAYASWLDATGRVPGARLCDEHEWERAARGADARPFPGGSVLAPDDANMDVTYGREPLAFGPDEVGAHPASTSPVGAVDLAGNVWELTVSVTNAAQPMLRGGSWYQGELTSRSMNREPQERTARDPLIGLRLCASLPSGVLDAARP
ncbi:SUMF1/EgtB/PvdO family nonheme iron enzyme, partial [Pyxidicoccus sp. 3LG]